MNRRSFNKGLLAMVAFGLSGVGRAQTPAITKLLVGFQAGGSFDTLARILAPALQEHFGNQVIVDNRSGAAGRLALEAVRDAKPNGEAFAVTPQGAMTLFPYVYKNLRFDPSRDFTPISRLVSFDYALTVGSGTPARTLPEYIQWLNANPGKAIYASPGAGTTPHFLGVGFHRAVGVPGTHVAYKGSAPGVIDVTGGRVPSMFSTLADAIQHHKNGAVRVIATTGAVRSTFLPEVPTLKESGIDLVVPGWIGLYGPANMPASLQSAYQKGVEVALQSQAVQARLASYAMVPAPSTSLELASLQKAELALWGALVKASGFTPEE